MGKHIVSRNVWAILAGCASAFALLVMFYGIVAGSVACERYGEALTIALIAAGVLLFGGRDEASSGDSLDV